jgi:hypothetical protein
LVATSGNSWRVGEFDRLRLDHAVVARDALQFDIEPVAEGLLQLEQPAFGELRP